MFPMLLIFLANALLQNLYCRSEELMQTINFLGCFFFMPVKTGEGAREVTQQLPVLTALAEDLGLISSIHLWLATVCNS